MRVMRLVIALLLLVPFGCAKKRQSQVDADLTRSEEKWLELESVQRSLPILGQTMHMRFKGVPASSLMFGAFELSANPGLTPIGCGCQFALTGTGMVLQHVPLTAGNRDWLLPVANYPALIGVPIDVQGLVFNTINPCFIMTTQRGTLVPGL